MELKNYFATQQLVTLDKFMNQGAGKALSFDFLSQGENPAESPLAKAIYRELFRWYDEGKHVGTVINPYQLAIEHFYKKPFEKLPIDVQDEILAIIGDGEDGQKTFYKSENFLTYDEVTSTGETIRHLSDNHMLGNFILMPRDSKIADVMKLPPYNDFFDEFLELVFPYYHEEPKRQDPLTLEMENNADYFANFADINAYVEDNFLEDYYQNGNILIASALAHFSTYVSYVKYVVFSRGEAMFQKLQLALVNEDPDFYQWDRIPTHARRLLYYSEYAKKLKAEFANGEIAMDFFDNR